MKRTEFWNWWITSETHHKRVKSSWKMTEADALKRDPKAERVPGTMELRDLPETPDEFQFNSDFQRLSASKLR